MTAEALIAAYRVAAQDTERPYLVSDDQVLEWLSEAEGEAAVRMRLLHESASAAVCEIDVASGTATYDLHESLYELTHVAFRLDGSTERTDVRLTSTGWLDQNVSAWRDETGTPLYAVQNETSIRLVPKPNAAGTLLLEGFRLPLVPMTDPDHEPEIHKAHHRYLVDWVLYRTWSVPDTELAAADKATAALARFTAYFGPRPDANLRRITREDVEHHNFVHLV